MHDASLVHFFERVLGTSGVLSTRGVLGTVGVLSSGVVIVFEE